MTHTEYMKKYRQERKEKHLCVMCGKRNEDKNRSSCRACRLYTAQRTRMIRAERHENGLCVYCCAPMGRDEHKNCKACRIAFAEVMRNRANNSESRGH